MFFARVNAIQELDDKEEQHIKEIPKFNKQIKLSVEQNKNPANPVTAGLITM